MFSSTTQDALLLPVPSPGAPILHNQGGAIRAALSEPKARKAREGKRKRMNALRVPKTKTGRCTQWGGGQAAQSRQFSWTLLPASLCALFPPPPPGAHEHERVNPHAKMLASDASPGPFHPRPSRQSPPIQTDRATLSHHTLPALLPACSEGQGTGSGL